MSEKYKERVTVVYQSCIAAGVYSIWLQTAQIAAAAVPGQFVSVYSNNASRILPRPISICEINKNSGMIRLVYRVVGEGTEEFSHLVPGDSVDIMGPLGNGFSLQEKSALLIGGGIGIPPMLELAKQWPGEKAVVAGYKDEPFLLDDFAQYAKVYTATEDGSSGVKGTVIDAIRANQLQADVICACGPTPMLRALKAYAQENGIECWISMEERMACGVGACLACVCQSTEVDGHSHVHNKRICKDGPVFRAEEVEL